MKTGARVKTGPRLHFGLLDLSGDMGRVDGGVGMALQEPSLVIQGRRSSSTKSNKFSKLVEYAVDALNKHYDENYSLDIKVEQSYPQHVGLGSTTQILLSVSYIYNLIFGATHNSREMANLLGRGGTSGIGVASFRSGGFILDGGHTFGHNGEKDTFLPSRVSNCPPAPVLFRHRIPCDWVIDLLIPLDSPGLSGRPEAEFFQKKCPIPPPETDRISRIVLSIILPSVISSDIKRFSKGINLLTTLGFKYLEIQNQSEYVRNLISDIKLVTKNQAAVGLSSFGPTVFVISQNDLRMRFIDKLKDHISDIQSKHEVTYYVTSCRNIGATANVW